MAKAVAAALSAKAAAKAEAVAGGSFVSPRGGESTLFEVVAR